MFLTFSLSTSILAIQKALTNQALEQPDVKLYKANRREEVFIFNANCLAIEFHLSLKCLYRRRILIYHRNREQGRETDEST